ncbi:MAG: hypothetical protein UY32_C0026G0006 [Candidatus Jorgensenbacteria bacterium GW2011_GWC1_48_8]|uniref:Uncharacterized protein n=1 Tax=Candidatus Jorgensenbacteria bacterium GW2011_GWC1_48_8 TaxID=1618666 RepID=A0A0G1UW77_9BACT|nr:MAG: hypothetical protein UY32_C0026G0006 [Candidatus Jorgensenbacteria bacterium GW2011_GWC1_48_8]
MFQGIIALPPGRTLDDVRELKPNEGEWRPLPGLFCISDSEPAVAHPNTDGIVGCPACLATEDFTDGHRPPRRFRRALVGSDSE